MVSLSRVKIKKCIFYLTTCVLLGLIISIITVNNPSFYAFCKFCKQPSITSELSTKDDSTTYDFFRTKIQPLCKAGEEIGSIPSIPFCKEYEVPKIHKKLAIISFESIDHNLQNDLKKFWHNIEIYGISATRENVDKHTNITYLSPLWLSLPIFGQSYLKRNLMQLLNIQQHNRPLLLTIHLENSILYVNQVKTILQELEHSKIQQLHMFVPDIMKLSSQQKNLWATLFSLLQKELKMGMYNVKTVNSHIHPQYITSWLQLPSNRSINLRSNLMSADKIAHNIIQLLLKNTTYCPSKIIIAPNPNMPKDNKLYSDQHVQWALCAMDNVTKLNQSVVYSISLESDGNIENEIAKMGSKVFWMDPFNKHKTQKKNIMELQWEISDKPLNASFNKTLTIHESKHFSLSLTAAAEILEHDAIDILILNLKGGEWEMINSLGNNSPLTIKQIIAVIHVWYGEEYYNLLSYLFSLQKFSRYGYNIFHSNPITSSKKKNNEQCSFVVGWTLIK